MVLPSLALLLVGPQAGGLERLLEPLRRDARPVSRPSAETRAQAAALVARDFGRFDANGDGRLGEAEFGRWMATLRPDAPGGAAEGGWTGRAFAAADLDGGGSLSPGEVERFVAETASWRLPAGEDVGR